MGWVEILLLTIIALEIDVGTGFILGAILASNKIADLEAKLLECEQDKVGARTEQKYK